MQEPSIIVNGARLTDAEAEVQRVTGGREEGDDCETLYCQASITPSCV
jgi:hypothetical protein